MYSAYWLRHCSGDEIRIPVLSSMMQTLIDKGGMVNYVKEQLKEMGE